MKALTIQRGHYRGIFAFCAIIALGALAPAVASAQVYPNKPIKMLLPYSPGGSGDTFARMVAEVASKKLGQPIIIEPKLGAGGSIAAELLAKSPPDGYTFSMIAAGILTINPHIYKSLRYDPETSLAPLLIGVRMPLAVVVNNQVPAKNIKELIAYAKKNPGKLTYGSAGTGSSQHLAGLLFQSSADIDITHVPYKGGAAAMVDLLGGHVSMQFVHLPSALNAEAPEKIRMLAVTSTERNPILPDVPTVAEAGLPGYDYNDWFGFVLPPGVPEDVAKKLQAALEVGLRESQEYFLKNGMVLAALGPKDMRQIARKESSKWGELLRESSGKQ